MGSQTSPFASLKRVPVKKKLGQAFYLLWVGQTISALGSQVTIIALPLVAVQTLNVSNFAVSALSIVAFLPYLLIGLQAGVYVDRLDRRTVMLVCDAIRAFSLLLIPVSAAIGFLSFWLLLLVAFANGCCTVFFEVAYTTSLPTLVASDQLTLGNARLELTRGAAQVSGPGLGGFLIQTFGAVLSVIADAMSFLCSFGFLLLLPSRKTPSERRKQTFWSDLLAGLAFVSRHTLLRSIITSYSLNALFIGAYQAIFIVYLTRTLYLSSFLIGLIFTCGNSGFILGATLSPFIAHKVGIGRAIIGALALIALGFLISGTAPIRVAFLWLLIGQLVSSFGVSLYNINFVSLRQVITPSALLGRTSAVSRVIGRGLVPLGALFGGIIATWLTPQWAVLLAGGGGLLAVLPVLLSPVRALRTLEDVQQRTP